MASGFINKEKSELNLQFETCPYCGNNVLKGAMRCVACQRILQTPEQQSAVIEKLEQSRKRFNTAKLIKFIIFLIAGGYIYKNYSVEIQEFINQLISK